MAYKSCSIAVDKDGIAVLSIDVPGQTMNVWNETLIQEFPVFIEQFHKDESLKGLVICSGKSNGFMAGADLRMLGSRQKGGLDRESFERGMSLSRALRRMETGGHSAKALLRDGKKAKPVACAIEGLALGGGLELPLACHYRVVADNPKIQLGLPEVLVGLLPGAGGTQRTPRLMGLQNAAMLCTQGKSLNPQTALAQGLIHTVVKAGTTIEVAKTWVRENFAGVVAPWDKPGFKVPGGAGAMNPNAVQFFMAANAMALKTTKGNFPAVQAILSCLYEGTMLAIDKALEIEVKYFTTLLNSPVTKSMIRTLFINKQAAEKGAARPADVPPFDIQTVGVLGAGLMGSGITHVSAASGMNVIVLDKDMESAQKAVNYSRKILEKKVAKGRMSKEKMGAFLARIHPTDSYEALKDVDLVIEAVFELPDVKADVIRKTEAVIGKDVIFASNTSTLPISGLAQNSQRPEQFIGMHFFSPVERMPLLEIIPHAGTGTRALACALDYNRKIRKTPIVVKDVRGFFTNQVFPAYVNEAIRLVMEGVSPALIENTALNLGLPIGPLALTDETTLKLGLDVMTATRQQLGDRYQPVGVEPFFEKMCNELERGGRRFGAGFYEYDASGKRLYLWPGLAEHYPLKTIQPTQEEVRERLLYAQLVPTAQCYADDVVSDPQSGDLGAIFGWGFPPWTGGPLSYIDRIGMDVFVQTADNLAQKYGGYFLPPQKFRDMAAAGESLYT